MNIHLTKSQIGLDGVPAAETVLSHVDGERGELIIAGEHVADLAGTSSFEGVTARLWSGATGQTLSEADVRKSLGAARERAFARLPDLLPATRGMSVVDGFRAAVAGLRPSSMASVSAEWLTFGLGATGSLPFSLPLARCTRAPAITGKAPTMVAS